MDVSNTFTKKNILITGIVICLAIFTLWIRILPMFLLGNADILTLVGSDDPLYNLRQVEHILSNFPNYAWFDPMTLYPNGEQVYWGSMFPLIIATCCKIFGAVSRTEIITIGLLVPPVMSAILVGVMYYVGKICGDWKTGLLSAGFMAIVSGQYFYRSMYGYMDHHIAETLFTTIFCLLYMYVLVSEKDKKIDLKNARTYISLIFLSTLTGIAYLFSLFVMPTTVLFALIVCIFTAVQFIINVMRGKKSEYLLMINIVVFTVAIIGMFLYGFNSQSIDLSRYSPGQIYIVTSVIMGSIFLYAVANWVLYTKKTWYHYVAILFGTIITGSLILMITSPQLYTLFVTSLFNFFGQQALSNTVQEARGWSWVSAWSAFSYGLILMLCGLVIAIYNNIKEEHPQHIFIIVWSAIIFFSTWQHVRYEYYLAINIALLSAICICFVIEKGYGDYKKLAAIITKKDTTPEPETTRKKHKNIRKSILHDQPNYGVISLVALFVLFGCLFAYSSVILSYGVSSSGINMNSDWKESLEWMSNNTPQTGVNYTTLYDKSTFVYPPESYGVMSWWDYGHMITYIAKRIPNANPFQEGITGASGSSTFFISTKESEANAVMDAAKTRYIITDIEMDTSKFWAMATWFDPINSISPYMGYYYVPIAGDPNNYNPILLNTDGYYLTMVSRLHNFDGSLAIPSIVYYVEYTEPYVTQSAIPTVIIAKEMNYANAVIATNNYNKNTNKREGYYATILNQNPAYPTTTIPALQHYRLVHESPTSAVSGTSIKYVKTFEYVRGYHIAGEGIIEVPIITNTGRTFIYTQNSINGEFIVPYSTDNNPYDVKTNGNYRINGNLTEYSVLESDVMGITN